MGCRENKDGAIVDMHVKRKTDECWVKSINVQVRYKEWRSDIEILKHYFDRAVDYYASRESEQR